MAKNPVQFQKGLGLHEFLDRYSNEEQCREALYQLCWPSGYVCPHCGYTTGCEIQQRSVYQCHKCHYQTSLTAGTLFHGTKLPLRTWFLAIYLLTQRKKSTSALQLSCELGVKYDTAWRLKHKLMQAMLNTSAISRCRSASNSMMPTWAESGRASAVAGPRTISLSSWPLRRRRTAGR